MIVMMIVMILNKRTKMIQKRLKKKLAKTKPNSKDLGYPHETLLKFIFAIIHYLNISFVEDVKIKKKTKFIRSSKKVKKKWIMNLIYATSSKV